MGFNSGFKELISSFPINQALSEFHLFNFCANYFFKLYILLKW